jgi:hypothetical protein
VLTLFQLVIWSILSLKNALVVISQQRVAFERSRCQAVSDFISMMRFALIKNITPLEYYTYRFYLPGPRSKANFFVPSWEMAMLSRISTERRRNSVATLHSKTNFIQFCAENDLPAPQSVTGDELSRDALLLPRCDLFVKPQAGFGGDRCHVILYDEQNSCWLSKAGRMADPQAVCESLKCLYDGLSFIVQQPPFPTFKT